MCLVAIAVVSQQNVVVNYSVGNNYRKERVLRANRAR